MKISLKSKLIGGAVCSLILTCALSTLSYTITAGLGYALQQAATIAGILGLTVCGGLIWVGLRETLRPLRRLQDAMQRLAAGDHKSAIPYEGRQDEIGSMAHAIERFRLGAIQQEKLEKAIRTSRDKERQ